MRAREGARSYTRTRSLLGIIDCRLRDDEGPRSSTRLAGRKYRNEHADDVGVVALGHWWRSVGPRCFVKRYS